MKYLVPSGPMQTTASFAALASGTGILTLLQLKPFVPLWIVEYDISFDGFAAALPGKIELIETDVAATVTASADADITKYGAVADGVAASVGGLTLGTAATGYNASAEGSITSVRNLDVPQFIAPTNQFVKQFPLGERPMIQVGKFGRIRVKFGTGVNVYCGMVVSTTP